MRFLGELEMEKDWARFYAPVLFGIVMSHNENRVDRRFAAFAAQRFAAFAVRGEPGKRQLDEVTLTIGLESLFRRRAQIAFSPRQIWRLSFSSAPGAPMVALSLTPYSTYAGESQYAQ